MFFRSANGLRCMSLTRTDCLEQPLDYSGANTRDHASSPTHPRHPKRHTRPSRNHHHRRLSPTSLNNNHQSPRRRRPSHLHNNILPPCLHRPPPQQPLHSNNQVLNPIHPRRSINADPPRRLPRCKQGRYSREQAPRVRICRDGFGACLALSGCTQ